MTTPRLEGHVTHAVDCASWHNKACNCIVSAAVKFDSGKVQLDLLSWPAIRGLGDVLTFGAKKYAAHNWRKGMVHSRLYAAALRHIFASLSGEDRDPESNLDHIDHAMCCLMFLSEYKKLGMGTDDRFKKEAT